MATREKLIQTTLDLAIELYDDFYFSQDSAEETGKAATRKLRSDLELEDTTITFRYQVEEETRYYWEFVSVKKILRAITIDAPPDPPETIIVVNRDTRIVELENQRG